MRFKRTWIKKARSIPLKSHDLGGSDIFSLLFEGGKTSSIPKQISHPGVNKILSRRTPAPLLSSQVTEDAHFPQVAQQ